VLLREGAVINEGLMLFNSGGERDIVVLAPSTEGVEEEDGVLVALLEEFLTGVLEEEAMSVMEGVADLEGEDGIGASLDHLVVDLLGSHSVVIKSVVPLDVGDEFGRLSGDAPRSLLDDVLGHGVAVLEASEGSGADLFVSVFEEDGVLNNSNNLAFPGEGNGILTLARLFEIFRAVLGDGDGHEVTLSLDGQSLHLEALEEFHLVHESTEGEGPSFSDSLAELSLNLGDFKSGVFLCDFSLYDEGVDNALFVKPSEDSLFDHVFDHHLDARIEFVFASVDGKSSIFGLIVGGGDSGEVGDLSSTGLLVQSLGIAFFAALDGSGDVGLAEFQVSIGVSRGDNVSGSLLGGDERAEDDLSSLVEKFGDFSDTADVLGTVLRRECEALVHTLTDDISIKAEDAGGVTDFLIEVLLGGLSDSRFTRS